MNAIVTIRKDEKGNVTVYVHETDKPPEKGMRLETGQYLCFNIPGVLVSLVHNDTIKPGGGDLPIDWAAIDPIDWPRSQ